MTIFSGAKKYGRGRAGAHHLPQRVLPVGDRRRILALLEVPGVGIVAKRPWASRIEALAHHHEPGLEIAARERAILEQRLERVGDILGIILLADGADPEQAALECRLAQGEIAVANLLRGHSEAQAGRDDRTGRRAADQIEVVRQPEGGIAARASAKDVLHSSQQPRRQQAPNSAAVEGKDALGLAGGIEVLLERSIGRHWAPLSCSTPSKRACLEARSETLAHARDVSNSDVRCTGRHSLDMMAC